MFLRAIHLKNVRCLSDIELSFNNEDGSTRKWTLLLGENGTGKSNLLKAIALVTAGSDAISDLIDDPDSWIQHGAEFCEIDALLVTKRNVERHISLRIERGDSRSDVIVRAKEGLDEIDDALDHAKRSYFVAGYGVSRRLSSHGTIMGKADRFRDLRAQSVATLFDRNADLTALESWAMDLDYRSTESGSGLKTVQQALNSFMPGVKFKGIDRENGQLMFETSDGIIPLRYLSDGFQDVASWIGDLLYRITETFVDYNNPLRARGLLLIDEIELHLHPQWQRNLIDFLGKKLPHFQIIATTHSPLTAQQANEGELFHLSRHGKSVSLKAFSGTPKNFLIQQLLTTDLFGLETAESVEVEQRKKEYRKLRDKADHSEDEKTRFETLKKALSEMPAMKRLETPYEQDQIELLRQIQKEMKEKSS